MKQPLTVIFPVLALATLAGVLLLAWTIRAEAGVAGVEFTMFKSPSCECCDSYVEVLRAAGGTVSVVDTEGMAIVKEDRGVPASTSSCHTIDVDGYVVEGHVPLAAIERLLSERPAVTGIALPGMPVGSPGMGGTKEAPFEVVAFGSQGVVPFGQF